MTQERMIRFNKQDYEQMVNLMGYEERKGDVFWVKFEMLEPAPPKDWRPLCYDMLCEERGHILEMFSRCKECIYRKKVLQ